MDLKELTKLLEAEHGGHGSDCRARRHLDAGRVLHAAMCSDSPEVDKEVCDLIQEHGDDVFEAALHKEGHYVPSPR